jgi:hypothetical protein
MIANKENMSERITTEKINQQWIEFCIEKILETYQIDKEHNCVFVKLGNTIYYQQLTHPEILENKDLVEQFVVGKNIREQIEYDLGNDRK